MPPRCTRRIIRLLIGVLLLTVLSPSFAWEASASQAAHGHDAVALAEHDRTVAPHQSGEDSHHHHGCAGHVLGHLQGQWSDAIVFAPLDASGSPLPEQAFSFSSSIPERLERPPLAPALV